MIAALALVIATAALVVAVVARYRVARVELALRNLGVRGALAIGRAARHDEPPPAQGGVS